MRARRLAWSLWAVCVLLAVVSLFFLAVNGSTTHSNTIGEPLVDALFGLAIAGSTLAVAALMRPARRPIQALLRGVVAETMQPAHVTLWLRGAQR